MKCSLIFIILLLVVFPYFSDANWCIQETTTNVQVRKVLTKIVTSRKFFGGIRRRTVSYVGMELVPRIRQHRVCCEGFTLDIIHRICEPNCPMGCPEFSGCVKPNTCECHQGYQMKGNSCEPICEPTCSDNALCSKPNVCVCKNGFEYNDSTKSCESSEMLSTLADLSTVREAYADSTTKLQTFSTQFDPSTTEATWTSATDSSDITERSTLDYHTRNAHCSYSYDCNNGHCRLVLDRCRCIRGFVKADSSCQLKPGFQLGECVEESLCRDVTTEEYRTSSEQAATEPTTPDYRSRNAYCSNTYKCDNGHCRIVLDRCWCKDGFVKADSSCHFASGFQPDECVEERLCRDVTTEKYQTSSEQILPIASSDTSTLSASTNVPSSCDESECLNGRCMNGFCQCPKGSVFSEQSHICINKSSCDIICHNGICQEDGVCECLQGFIYQYDKGCVPNCTQICINGICVAPGKCKCLDGFVHNPENVFECKPVGKLSEKLERNGISNFPWIWVVLTFLVMIIFGLFIVVKKTRKHNYDVDKNEEIRHIVQFESKCV